MLDGYTQDLIIDSKVNSSLDLLGILVYSISVKVSIKREDGDVFEFRLQRSKSPI